MAHTVSKFLALGMSIEDIIASVTVNPLNIINASNKETFLRIGTIADLAIFDIRKGSFEFKDSYGNINMGDYLLSPWATIHNEQIYYQ